jgi:hypothetical protein
VKADDDSDIEIPSDLAARVQRMLTDEPALSWDQALLRIKP